MITSKFITALRKIFPENQWGWIFPALRTDAIVWRALETELSSSILKRASVKAEDYTPIALARLAAEFHNDNAQDEQASTLLAHSGQQAIQLNQMAQHPGSWAALSSQLLESTPTVLACLFGLADDPRDLLISLAGASQSNQPAGFNWDNALHVLLSNPMPPENHLFFLTELAKACPNEQIVTLVESLSGRRPNLARQLAQELLSTVPSSSMSVLNREDSPLKNLSKMQQVASLYELAGMNESAAGAWQSAYQELTRLSAQYLSHQAKATQSAGDLHGALSVWEQAEELDQANLTNAAGYSLALMKAGRSADAQGKIENRGDTGNDIHIQFAAARLALLRGNQELAAKHAAKVWEIVYTGQSPDQQLTAPDLDMSEIAALLLEVNLPIEACQAIDMGTARQPGNPHFAALAAQARLAAGQYESAVESAHLAAAIQPGNLEYRNLLAEALGYIRDWPAAYQERRQIALFSKQHTRDEEYALGATALLAGEVETAITIGERLTEEYPTDGLSWALLGEANNRLGQLQPALEHLVKATNLTPQHPAPWLALAQLYNQNGLEQKSIETLQSAAHAAPGYAEIQLALGEAYLSRGLLTQAQSALSQAADMSVIAINPRNEIPWYSAHLFPLPVHEQHQDAPVTGIRNLITQINLRLGQALFQLGHLNDACKALAFAYAQAPGDAEIAWHYAQTLLALNNNPAALPPLKAVIESSPNDIAPYLHYARIILEMKAQADTYAPVGTAIPYLRHVLTIVPDHPEATAYLAEALAAQNELEPALKAYQKALDSELSKDRQWQARLSSGLGMVAYQLALYDISIAALLEASQADSLDPHIQQSLALAYQAAGLHKESYQSALRAWNLGPNDVSNLAWLAAHLETIADQSGVPAFDTQHQVIEILQRATQLDPDRYDLWVRLGVAHQKLGNVSAAQEAYRVLAERFSIGKEPALNDLYQVARGLLAIGDPATAAACLERALQSSQATRNVDSPDLIELLTLLTRSRYLAGEFSKALESLENVITLDQNEPHHHLDKATILVEQQHDPNEIREAILTAIELAPADMDLHQRALQIYRQLGDLPQAMSHAERFIQLSQAHTPRNVIARAYAADLALAMLQPEIARNYLDISCSSPLVAINDEWQKHAEETPANSLLPVDSGISPVDFYCTRAELDLLRSDPRAAIDQAIQILEAAPAHPRLMALQARLANIRNESQHAQTLLETALEGVDDLNKVPVVVLVSLATAAIELQQWKTAEELWRKIAERAPVEPRSHLELARTLVLQAEFQRLCQAMEIVHRSPGEAALSEDSHDAFESAISKAETFVANLQTLQHEVEQTDVSGFEFTAAASHRANQQIQRWQSRGLAAFHPSQESAQSLADLPRNPEDTAARVACLRHIGDLYTAGLAAREFPGDPIVLIQLTLALIDDKPRQALAAVHVAMDSIAKTDQSQMGTAGLSLGTITPMIHILTARLLHRNGNRVEDSQGALQAIRAALAAWHDEPRWHILAADIHLAMSSQADVEDQQAALIHLKQASEMEPENAVPHIKMGQLYYRENALQQAIQSFDQAARLAPNSEEPFLWLARSHQMLNNLNQAAAYADQAVAIEPDLPEPLLLRGEIALETSQPRQAESCAQSVLRLYPDHPQALVLLAQALGALNRPDEALGLLDKALQKTTDPLPLRLERIRLLHRARGLETALQAATRLSEEFPDEPQVLSLLAEIQEAADYLVEAVRSAQRALRVQSTNLSLSNRDLVRTHYLLGRLMRRSGQLDQAVHHLGEAIRYAPEMVEAYLELGQAYQERREHHQALDIYQQALAAAPNDPRAYVMIGQALKESKDYVGAETMLRRAAEVAPQDSSIHRQLAAVVALNLVHNRRETAMDSHLRR